MAKITIDDHPNTDITDVKIIRVNGIGPAAYFNVKNATESISVVMTVGDEIIEKINQAVSEYTGSKKRKVTKPPKDETKVLNDDDDNDGGN